MLPPPSPAHYMNFFFFTLNEIDNFLSNVKFNFRPKKPIDIEVDKIDTRVNYHRVQ